MAQRTKYRWRGQTHTRASRRPGKRVVHVRPYCRRQARALWRQAAQKAQEWGF